MSGAVVWVELALVVGLVLAFGVHELWSLRKDERSKRREEPETERREE